MDVAFMVFRVAVENRTTAVFGTGRHVLVDASGAGQGRYCMAAVCMENGEVVQLHSKPCEAFSSVLAEQESIEWAFTLWPHALVWNDCIPAIEAVLDQQPALAGQLYWPTPRMRKPFHDMVHSLSVKARGVAIPAQWNYAFTTPGSARSIIDFTFKPLGNAP
ncbi:hypothetical protein [Limnobacter sp. MED105]|uniref:hypothetical protein n=1 Tax=unclassified Limnobacter TaxID=2630203 RepID=UPI000156C345|nr:hypothetical protein [Limnobacter sp. MED105]EDM82962.1 hypothetical protein LMED105_11770 [Limnobacter sp. MED105]